jgi:diguanylate cyclase (GGDEF)-like protein
MDSPVDSNTPLKDLMVFHNVARALTSALDLDSILRAIMEQMAQFFEPETWSLLMLDEQRQELYYAVAVGQAEAELHSLRVKVGEGMAGWVAEHGESLIIPEVSLDPRFTDPKFTDPGLTVEDARLIPEAQRSGFRIRSAICMPLRSRQRTLGVIQLFNCKIETFTDYTISFLHVLCDYAAISIENARAFERIQELTITDDCTGLYNQRHLYRLLEAEFERSRRSKIPFSVIFIDLDHFKLVNDAHGHQVGSNLLAEVAHLLRSLLRKSDSAFRYGGDEFIILLPDSNKTVAKETAERLLHAIRSQSFRVAKDLEIQIRASLGVATYPDDGNSIQHVIRSADKVMYMVKGTTRDGVAVAGQRLLRS